MLLEAYYRDSGKDAYPDILKKAPPVFFEKEPGYSDILSYMQQHGEAFITEGSTHRPLPEGIRSKKPWADRTLFKEILDHYHLLPITVDSHFGEYISWAQEVVDHKGIKDFYLLYQKMLSRLEPKIELKVTERLVYILEGIEENSGYEELAVNILNNGLIGGDLPPWIAVEVPAKVYSKGMKGVAFADFPKGFAALLRNYCGVYDLTAEAVLQGKKEYVIQALLANPVVHTMRNIPELVDMMIERQHKWLGYLR